MAVVNLLAPLLLAVIAVPAPVPVGKALCTKIDSRTSDSASRREGDFAAIMASVQAFTSTCTIGKPTSME